MTNSHYTNLYSIIDKYLLSNIYKQRQTIQNMIFKEPLLFSVMQCSNLKFASDLRHTIQLIVDDKNGQVNKDLTLQINPFNKLSTNYYRKLDQRKFNFWQAYNCKNQSPLKLENTQQYSPYTPHFYFGKGFEQFISMKAADNDVTLPPSLNNKTIKITQWKIKIVNISESGWYAPILEAITWKFEKLINRENFKDVSLILYEPKVKQALQQMWRIDLKKTAVIKKQLQSCFYSKMRTTNKTTSVFEENVFYQDRKQVIIKYQKNKRYCHIPINKHEQQNLNLYEELYQNYQLQSKSKQIQKQQKIKLKKSSTNKIKKKDDEKQTKQKRVGQLWSSQQEFSEEQQQLEQIQIQSDEEQIQEQSSQLPGFLCNTYLKYLKFKKNLIK